MTRRAVASLLFAFVPEPRAQAPGDDLKPTVILISFDGWRWDYESRYSARVCTVIERRRQRRADSKLPVEDVPQPLHHRHRLYPGHHGIVANSIKDPPPADD